MGGLGSGPKRKLSTLMRESIDQDRENLPAYFDKLSEIALRGDKEALIYLINRHLGSPKQSIDARVKASREYSPEELALMREPFTDQAGYLNGWGESEVIPPSVTVKTVSGEEQTI